MGSSAGIAISCVSNNEDETQDEPSNFRNHHVTSVLSPIRTTFPYCALKKITTKNSRSTAKNASPKPNSQSTSIFSGRRSSHKCDFGTTTVAPFSALKLSSKAQTVAMEKGCRGRGNATELIIIVEGLWCFTRLNVDHLKPWIHGQQDPHYPVWVGLLKCHLYIVLALKYIEMTVFLGVKTATTLRTLTKFLNIEKTLPLHAATKQPVLRLAGS